MAILNAPAAVACATGVAKDARPKIAVPYLNVYARRPSRYSESFGNRQNQEGTPSYKGSPKVLQEDGGFVAGEIRYAQLGVCLTRLASNHGGYGSDVN